MAVIFPHTANHFSSGLNAGGIFFVCLVSTYGGNQYLAHVTLGSPRTHALRAPHYATAKSRRALAPFSRSPGLPNSRFPVTLTIRTTSPACNSVRCENQHCQWKPGSFTESRSDPTGLRMHGSLRRHDAGQRTVSAVAGYHLQGSLGGFQAGNVYSDFLNLG